MLTTAELIVKQAQEKPNEVFLRFQHQSYTFLDLKKHVEELAASLHYAGIKRDDKVGILLNNNPDHIFAYLALNWIGATIIEFSVFLKSAGLHIQLSDCKPHFMFADETYVEQLTAATARLSIAPSIMWYNKDTGGFQLKVSIPAEDNTFSPPHIEPAIDLDRLQAISYTSGTTGPPKGAMLSERWFQIGAKSAGLLAGVRQNDVLFLWEPFYHVAGWMTVLISLQHGICIGMVERFSGSKCWEQIERFGATLLHYLGGVIDILLAQDPSDNDSNNTIRVAWGGAAPKRSWREFEQRFGLKIREGYGLSEGQNFTHVNIDGPIGSIGLPTEEFESWIEAEDGTVLKPGEVGEIVLKPKQPNISMMGYFGDKAKTAHVLKNDCIYTGDLGYQDEDGFYYFSGRKKDSLRRRGENVSAWEVERVLNAHASIEESAVIGVIADIGEQDIKAVVKLVDGAEFNPSDLIDWCQRELAYYQVPRYIELVKEFPYGPTQRIKKAELSVSVDNCWDAEAK